jgi:hypothetical protein
VRKDPTYAQLGGTSSEQARIRSLDPGDFPGSVTRKIISHPDRRRLPSRAGRQIATVEEKLQGLLHDATYHSEYREQKLYLSAKVFKDFFHGKVPDFAGKGTPTCAMKWLSAGLTLVNVATVCGSC